MFLSFLPEVGFQPSMWLGLTYIVEDLVGQVLLVEEESDVLDPLRPLHARQGRNRGATVL